MSTTRLIWITTVLLAGQSTAPSSLPAQRSAPTDTLIDVGGHRLHLRSWAGRGALTIVFEAGGGADLTAWGTVPARLAGKTALRIVAYDRAGMGQSDLGPQTLTPFDEIAQLDRALDTLGIKRIVLVGHSYGGMLSLYHAARHPDRVVGLVLVDPMNPIFIDKVTLAWLNTTVPDFPDPKTPQEIVTSRLKSTMPAFADSARRTLPSIRVPMVVITAGVPWFGKPPIDSAWRESHEALVAGGKPREFVIAAKSKHDIPDTEPEVIVGAIEHLFTLVERASKR